jgi:acylphosphatase
VIRVVRSLVAVIRRRVVILGYVQGVGFRFSAARAARLHGVAGWIRNRNDGTVEAVFEGEPDAVDTMVRWCEEGPRGGSVDRVDVRDEPPEGLSGFRID